MDREACSRGPCVTPKQLLIQRTRARAARTLKGHDRVAGCPQAGVWPHSVEPPKQVSFRSWNLVAHGSESTVKKQVTVCGNKRSDRLGEGTCEPGVSSSKAGIQHTRPSWLGRSPCPARPVIYRDSSP